ncbi:uncharacterized protein LOC132169595 [Corylus avellana]|uniref:uncharacterized protein LOC132169595 n=1 Tax=Corylus avellana TaxID=13451 RepID=UPI00286B38A4|nr:uncharacterized protein LOC132169595 [Corylus avellana]
MDVWCMGSRTLQESKFTGPNFIQVVEGVLAKCSTDEVKLFVGLARRILLRRNEVVHGGDLIHPSVLLRLTTNAITEYHLATATEEPAQVSIVEHPSRWMAPYAGWLKMNWDAALNHSQGYTGFGLVLRDSRGHLVAAQCVSKPGVLTPSGAELTGALMAVYFCKSLGLTRVQFEGDAQAAVDDINSSVRDMSSLGHVVDDIRTELQGVSLWKFTFVRRDGNRAAHLLSRFAASYAVDKISCDTPPVWLRDIICLEQIAPGE